MTVVNPDLLERLRRALAAGGLEPTPTKVAEALRAEGQLLGHAAVLDVVDALRRDIGGAGPLDPLLRGAGVTDVVVNGPDDVYVDRGEGLERADVSFADEDAVRRLAQRLATAGGRRLDDHPSPRRPPFRRPRTSAVGRPPRADLTPSDGQAVITGGPVVR